MKIETWRTINGLPHAAANTPPDDGRPVSGRNPATRRVAGNRISRTMEGSDMSVTTINVLLARRRAMGALTVQEQQQLSDALAALEGAPIEWRAYLGDIWLGVGPTQEAAIADAVREYEASAEYGGEIPDADHLRERLALHMEHPFDWDHDTDPDWDSTGTIADSWYSSYGDYDCRIDRGRDGGYTWTVTIDGSPVDGGESVPAESHEDAERAIWARITDGTVRIAADEECAAPEWWEAARCDPNAPPQMHAMLCGATPSVYVSASTAERIRQWAERLPGWDQGPDHAPTPLLFHPTND